MNKTFKLLLVTIVTMVMTTLFVGTSIVGLANPIEQTSASPLDDIINYNEIELYDLHDNVAYLLRFGSMGGYSITHIASGIVCEYDEYRINPYSSTEGRLYYGGPGAYYLMPYAVVGKIGAKEFFNITNEALQQLDSINQGFIEDSQSISIASVTDSTGYTLISQHAFVENYYLSSSLNNDNGCGKAASILLLRFYDQYYHTYGRDFINSAWSDSDLYHSYLSTQLWNNGPSLCSSIKQGLINYLDDYAPNPVGANITYNILSPRNKIIERIAQDQPSILVLTSSNNMEPVTYGLETAHCVLVFGFKGDYYRVHSTWDTELYNVHRRYAYGGVFLNV